MPGPLDYLASGGLAPFSIPELINRLMQSQQTPPPPKIEDQFMGQGGTTDIAKNILPMLIRSVQTQSIPSPQVSTQAVPPTPANPVLPPVARGPQWGLPPQQQSYYNLLSGGFGAQPYRIPT